MVANSSLDVVTVNGRDAPRNVNSGPKQNSGCAWSKTKTVLKIGFYRKKSLFTYLNVWLLYNAGYCK